MLVHNFARFRPLVCSALKSPHFKTTLREFTTKTAVVEEVKAPSLGKLISNYASLTKAKLGSLVAISTVAGYLAAPGDFDASQFIVTTVVS